MENGRDVMYVCMYYNMMKKHVVPTT
jgi:hypothetical protein